MEGETDPDVTPHFQNQKTDPGSAVNSPIRRPLPVHVSFLSSFFITLTPPPQMSSFCPPPHHSSFPAPLLSHAALYSRQSFNSSHFFPPRFLFFYTSSSPSLPCLPPHPLGSFVMRGARRMSHLSSASLSAEDLWAVDFIFSAYLPPRLFSFFFYRCRSFDRLPSL